MVRTGCSVYIQVCSTTTAAVVMSTQLQRQDQKLLLSDPSINCKRLRAVGYRGWDEPTRLPTPNGGRLNLLNNVLTHNNSCFRFVEIATLPSRMKLGTRVFAVPRASDHTQKPKVFAIYGDQLSVVAKAHRCRVLVVYYSRTRWRKAPSESQGGLVDGPVVCDE